MIKAVLLFALVLTCGNSFSQALFSRERIVVIGMSEVTDPTDCALYYGQISKGDLGRMTPILGHSVLRADSLTYHPLVPLAFGQYYTFSWGDHLDHFMIALPDDYNRLTVDQVYPSGRAVPQNLLKWYVKFNRPVNISNISDFVIITNDKGEELERAILPLESALVTRDKTLLTLWMEPGRLKQGLGPHERLGETLEIGHHYALEVSDRVRDQNGVLIEEAFTHRFEVVEPDRTHLDVSKWKLQKPGVDTKEHLIIDIGEVLDYGSVGDKLSIELIGSGAIEGSWSFAGDETQLLFVPDEQWRKGQYYIHFGSTIEDLAGNNLNRLFDHPITNDSSLQEQDRFYKVFSID